MAFAKSMVQMGFIRKSRQCFYAPVKTFAASTRSRTEFRFHINCLAKFKLQLAKDYITEEMVEYIYLPVPIPEKTNLKIYDHWKLRDYQLPAVEYIVSDDPPIAKLVSMATGRGKGLISMWGSWLIGHRIVVIVRPMYIEKWVKELREVFTIGIEEPLVIQGGAQLMALLEMGVNGTIKNDIIIISNKTLQNWIKAYEEFESATLDLGYSCYPDQLFEVLGAGIRLVDEVHQDYHFQFKLDCYTNVRRSISLSATLLSDDDFINNMYEVAYPGALRFRGEADTPHVTSIAVFYKFRKPELIRYKDNISKMYNHHLLENSVMKYKDIQNNYFDLVVTCIEGTYIKKYKPGHKCLVFCISIKMCTLLREYLAKRYPKLKVNRYVEDDEFSELLEGDITISTMQSSGTAVDIPNLTTVIMTTAMSSSQSNVQGYGRLRALKNDDTPTEFVYFVCESIKKHTDYHEKKRNILKTKEKAHKNIYIGKHI